MGSKCLKVGNGSEMGIGNGCNQMFFHVNIMFVQEMGVFMDEKLVDIRFVIGKWVSSAL